MKKFYSVFAVLVTMNFLTVAAFADTAKTGEKRDPADCGSKTIAIDKSAADDAVLSPDAQKAAVGGTTDKTPDKK